MITVKCDFCGEIIETHDTKGVAASQGTVDIIESRCNTCTKTTLDADWNGQVNQDKLYADWKLIEDEKKNFLNSLLINQKEEFVEAEKKKHYGTLFATGE